MGSTCTCFCVQARAGLHPATPCTQRHHRHACASAGVPVSKEPSGLFPGDIRRPDGITLIPWQTRKALAWDATVTSTLAGSYIHQSATTAGAAAELAAARKVSKYEYSCLFMFQPVVLETLSPINKSAIRFMEDLGGRISAVSSEAREGVFLFQRLSVLMQRFNAILVRDLSLIHI